LTAAKIIVGFVYAVLLVYIVILGMAFFLRLFGANPGASFVNWVYTAANRIMEPFRGIFPTTQISDRAVFDASLLFAMIIYSLFALAVHALITWLATRAARLRAEDQQLQYRQPAPQVPTAAVDLSREPAPR
jgi:hypothetical protein